MYINYTCAFFWWKKNQPNVQNPKRNKTEKKKKKRKSEKSSRNKARIYFSKGDKLSKFEEYYKPKFVWVFSARWK